MKHPLLLVLLIALLPSVASAAEEDMNFVKLLSKGGYVMVALAALSVFTLMLVLLYFLTLRRSTVVTNKFMNAAEAMIRKRDYLGLIAYCLSLIHV